MEVVNGVEFGLLRVFAAQEERESLYRCDRILGCYSRCYNLHTIKSISSLQLAMHACIVGLSLKLRVYDQCHWHVVTGTQ